MNRKKLMITLTAAALVLTASAGGTLAYLTDTESHPNTFTVGDVKADLIEPGYDTTDEDENDIPDKYENMLPNQMLPKDPAVTNSGDNDAVIFLKVTVPVKNVTAVAFDGTKGDKKAQEIFYLKNAADKQNTLANSFNTTNWTELTAKESGTDMKGSTRTYVFGYKKVLKPGETTDNLFDKIQLKNIAENEITAGTAQTVDVEAYAIQASQLMTGGDTAFVPGSTVQADDLSKIYDIYVKQSGSASAKEAAESGKLDLSGNEL